MLLSFFWSRFTVVNPSTVRYVCVCSSVLTAQIKVWAFYQTLVCREIRQRQVNMSLLKEIMNHVDITTCDVTWPWSLELCLSYFYSVLIARPR